MSLRLLAASATDVGRQREQNEDNEFTQIVEDDQRSAGIFVVADGMGGYHAGEIASQIAVETLQDALSPLLASTPNQPTIRLNKRKGRNKRQKQDDIAQADVDESNGESREGAVTQQLAETVVVEHYADQLRAAVERASQSVVEYGMEHHEAQGLGSTLTAALIVNDTAYIANVGDSRTYLFHDGKLQRITHDHSLVEQLVQAGQITRDEAYDHPSRNLIYRSLGAGKAEVTVDIFTEQLSDGDALLLCSDGLWEMVRDPQIESILAEVQDPAEATRLLIDRANENGGEDNITAVLVRCVAR